MRFSTISVFAALSSVALGQGVFGSLPKCAQDCFGNSFGNCGQLDFKCVCGNATLISNLSCCVFSTCNQADQDSTIKLASNLCQANGVTVPTSASCASGASTPAPTASGASQSGASSGSASTTPASQSSGSAGGASSASQAGASGATGAEGGSTGAAPTATAAALGMGLAMAMGGMLAAL